MKTSIEVDNIKCGGCSNRIVSKISSIPNVEDIEINVEKGLISFHHSDENTVGKVAKMLKVMGYPEKGKGNKLDNAKSYVSCMIGRVQG